MLPLRKRAMSKAPLPPHLVPYGKLQRCSICGQPFFPDSKPSVIESFEKHVLMHHKPAQKTEDFSQAAAQDYG
jgi:hypothetical protein